MKGFYRHERAMDAFIEVLQVKSDSPTKIDLIVKWWNRSQTGKPWEIIVDHISIQKEHLTKWRPCNDKGEFLEDT